MDGDTLLSALNKLDAARKFVSILLIRNIDDDERTKKIEVAGNLLNFALVNLSFNLRNRLVCNISEELSISNSISAASDNLQDLNEFELECALKELITFSNSYNKIDWLKVDKKEEIMSRASLISSDLYS